MKKIIFSFDDGLLDFYENVFPVLKKYKIKATLNVITGFTDKTVKTNYNCCSVSQLQEMLEYGIELTNHSNDHLFPESLNGYDKAQKKLRGWFPECKISGVVTPYTQAVPDNFSKWCKLNKIKYVRLGETEHLNSIQRFLTKTRIISRFRFYCHNNSHYSKNKGIVVVNSFPVFENKSVDYYARIISLCHLRPNITLFFHSIVKDETEIGKCIYPETAWTVSKFEELIKWILNNGYKICRQIDTIK